MNIGYLPGEKRENMESLVMPKVFVKDIKDIRNALVPEAVASSVRIHCLAIHKDDSKNREIRIHLNRCIPIEGYVYNQITDKYAVVGFDSLDLGEIGVAYKIQMGGVGNWSMTVPMPEMVLKRYMSPDQRRILARYKADFRELNEEVRYEYIQMLSAYPYG